jgi:hypothetical protein
MAANGHLQNYPFAGCVSMSHLDVKIRGGCEQLLIIEVNLITANVMFAPRFVIIPGIWAECTKDAIDVMQVLESNVFLDKLDSGFDAVVA